MSLNDTIARVTDTIVERSRDSRRRYLDQIAAFHPEPRGLTRQGFLRLKLDLSDGA